MLIRNTANPEALLVYNHYEPGSNILVFDAGSADTLAENIVNGSPVIDTFNMASYYLSISGVVDSWYYMTYSTYYYVYIFQGSDMRYLLK